MSVKKNVIDDEGLKNHFASTAYAIIYPGKQLDLTIATVEFGYLFDVEGRGIEALFKISQGRQTFYFAVQNNSFLRPEHNDRSFKNAVKSYMDANG